MAGHAGQASPGEIPPERTEPAAETPAAETPAPEPGPSVAGPPAAVPAARPLPRQEMVAEPAAATQHAPASGPARTGESKRWELVIAMSIALITVTGAVLTYLSIQQESAAVEADRQSVVETLQIQNEQVSAETEARAFGILAARYRDLMAEASALAATDPEQVSMLREDAAGFSLNGVTQYLTGTGATAQYNFSAALQGALTTDESTSIPPDQPALTAQVAEHHRQVSARVALCVVGLLCVLVMLTLARLLTAERLRRLLAGAGAAVYLAAVITAIAQLA
jgi:hypothetical protein